MPALLSDEPRAQAHAAFPDGPEQGVIEEARRRQRSRRLRALVAAAVALGATGILIAATAGGAARTHAVAHVPSGAASPPIRHAGSPSQSIVVKLSPDLEGGRVGWCELVVHRSGEGGGCGPLPTRAHPLLVVSSGWQYGEPDATTTAVTAPRVAYVLVNGRHRTPTVAVSGLPYGLRAAAIHTPLPPNFQRRVGFTPPKLVALDSRGRRIRETPAYELFPDRDWHRPGAPAKGACQLHASGLPGLIADWGQVASAVFPYPGRIVGRGFVSCIDTEYYVPGRGMLAAVLLDAAKPGHATPGEIPGLAPIPGNPGLYNGAGDYDFHGPMTAKREGEAWIVVAGGGRDGEPSRIRLLRHLTAIEAA
jgi:hypothetical protein